MEHRNADFNILQHGTVTLTHPARFVVIEGQRTASGNMAYGARVVAGEPMTRDEAIRVADRMQAALDG